MLAGRVLSIAFFLGLASCGGGSGSSSSGGTPGALGGQYIDAPTAGLGYTASPSGLTGVTDASGNFSFVAGDTVSFSVQSSDKSVTVPLGNVAPVAPNGTGSKSIVSVLTLPNGNEIAQAIQSFAVGGTDFRSVAISTAHATALKNYITSGGVTTPPTPPTGTFVSSDVAVNNALQYVSQLTTQPVTDVSNLISGRTFFSGSTFTDSGGTVHPNGAILYFAPGGTYYEICVNTIFNGLMPNPCNTNNGNPVSHIGSWAVKTDVSNTFTLSGAASNGGGGTTNYISTITAPIMDASKGIFTTSQTNDGILISGTGAGKYQNVQSTFVIDSMAGKAFTVSGFRSCTDGLRRYTFQQVAGNSLSYTWTCPQGYTTLSGAATSGVATNALVAGTAIPGVVTFTDTGSTDPLYVGVTTDSTGTSGIAMAARVGNSGSGCSYTLPNNCTGFVRPSAFTLQ
jgi:hypothetical protein